MKLFVANFPFSVTQDELNTLFASFGEVSETRIIKNHATGHSRGFAFVEMPDEAQARDALGRLHGRQFQGRQLRVHNSAEHGPAAIPFPAVPVSPSSDPSAAPAATATPEVQRAGTGTIRAFCKDRLTGRIRTDDGLDVFFHNNDFRGVWPEPGERVSFDINTSPRGFCAVAVRPL